MCILTLFLVGATHRTAPFGFREKLALGTEAEAVLAAELAGLPALGEFAVLNTCNRVEIYGVATDPGTPHAVADAFCHLRHVAAADFERYGFVLHGREAVAHLLRVAAGLDSQVLGETEIFGQVKRAYATAQSRASAGPVLNRLFQKAFQAAKHVRTTAGVSNGHVSVANIAVETAAQLLGDPGRARLLILGAGEMAGKSARAFRSRGVRQVTIASRHFERAAALAGAVDATAVPFDTRDAAIADADIVVSSTACPDAVVSLAAVQAALAHRGGRPLLLIDLAMPRDIEAGVAALPGVHLYNLDDLARVAARNRQAREASATASRLALAPRTDSLWRQLQLQLVMLTDEEPVAAPAPIGTPLPSW